MRASDRRDRLLQALKAAAPGAVSGEEIARDLGVSRPAIAKHVRALRDLGYEIVALPGAGYSLRSVPDLPLPTEVRPLLRSELWVELSGGGPTGSTNDDARALARAGAPEGTVVLASRQTAGRGRLGRDWVSPEGGVYASAVLRPQLPPFELAPLALVVALGIADGLSVLGVEAQLKWPNDVHLGGRKLAGVLLEMAAEADRVEWIVAGFGINVRRSADTLSDAVTLADVAEVTSVAAVAAAVLDGIARAYHRFLASGFEDLRGEWSQRDALAGSQVCVRDALGTVIAEGMAAGIDGQGRLIVRKDGPGRGRALGREDEVHIFSGEVTLRV